MYGLILHCIEVITVKSTYLQTDRTYSESTKNATSDTEQRRWIKEKLNSTPDTVKIPALLSPMAPQHGIVIIPARAEEPLSAMAGQTDWKQTHIRVTPKDTLLYRVKDETG